MNRILADFISPRVSHIHQTDPTIESIKLLPNKFDKQEKINQTFTSDLIENFKLISSGHKIEIDKTMSIKLRILSIFLYNEEIYNEMNSLFPIELTESDFESYFDYLEYFKSNEAEFKYMPTFVENSLFNYISSHFSSIDQKILHKLNKNDLYSIICNEQLKLADEDSLFDFINEIFSYDQINEKDNSFPSRIDFYEQVLINFLSSSKKIEFIQNIEASEITNQIWSNIRDFLIDKITDKKEKTPKNSEMNRYLVKEEEVNKLDTNCDMKNVIEVPFLNENFNGILTKLGNGNAINALNEGKIKITSSSVSHGGSNVQPKNVVNFESDRDVFESRSEQNSWLCIEFKNCKVKLSNYSIRSADYGEGYESPLCWCIEGSNNGNEWTILNNRQNETCFIKVRTTNTYTIQNNGNHEFY